MKSDWDSAVKLWKEHAVRPVGDGGIKFRGSCVRDGKHTYNSQTVAGEVGARVIEKFGWGVNLTEFDLEVVVVIFYKFMVSGIALADPRKIQFRNRLANESRSALADSQYVSTLRPSTAYLMLQLVQHKYGDVVLDSMCGIGTLPICSADFTNDGVYALGGELDGLPTGKAGQNALTRARPVDIARWDSTRLPLRSHSIDRIMIDMPFGVRCGNQRQNNKARRSFHLIVCYMFHFPNSSSNSFSMFRCTRRSSRSSCVFCILTVEQVENDLILRSSSYPINCTFC